MELEFDKEIDAILRKARNTIGVSDPGSAHPDADAIVAFAENALPEKARLMCIDHFADCDHCRKLLSRAVQFNADALAMSAEPIVSAAAIETVVPWYQRIFRMPNLAFMMGGLVLVFSGVLGFLVLKQQNDAGNATVSRAIAPAERRDGSSRSGQESDAIPTPSEVPTMSLNANTMSNAAPNSLAGAPLGETRSQVESDSPGAKLADDSNESRGGGFQIDGASGSENNFVIDGQETTSTTPQAKSAAAAPPTTTTDLSSAGAPMPRDEKNVMAEAPEEEGKKDSDGLAKTKRVEGFRRDMPAAAAKSGPARSGPLQQNQANQVNNRNIGEMSVVRNVGGKTFTNRDGAWYDSAYDGKPVINVRRGTGEYKKLDKGLRNIADTIDGIVIVAWKSKAYRIQ